MIAFCIVTLGGVSAYFTVYGAFVFRASLKDDSEGQ